MTSDKEVFGSISIPEDKRNWRFWVSKGTVYGTAPGGRKYTDAERQRADESDKKVRAAFVTKAKRLRDAESSALREFKKNPLSDKLKNAYLGATAEREAFDKERKAAETKARREAREKALK